MDQITQQNATLMEKAAAAPEALQRQASNLAQVVSMFKLDGMQLMPVMREPRLAPVKSRIASLPQKPAAKPSVAIPAQAPKRIAKSATADDWEDFKPASSIVSGSGQSALGVDGLSHSQTN